MIDTNESAEILIGNKPDIRPDVGKPVQLSEELPFTNVVTSEPTTIEIEPQPKTTRRRRKRGRPPMTKAAKKAAAAKKAPAKKAAAPKTAALSAKKEAIKSSLPMSKMTPAVETRVMEFQPREGTMRKRLLIALCSAVNKPIRVSDLQVSIYGEINDASRSALGMVLKGVATMIAKEKLKYELTRAKNSDGEAVVILKSK